MVIDEYLAALGFSKEETALYVGLVKYGPMTLLEASRKTKIERTKLYRLIETLAERGIIEEIPEYKRRTIKAADISTIELLVKERERKDTFLKQSFLEFSGQLEDLQSKQFPGNNVIYYRGREGMRQMTWHILRCKGLLRMYSHSFWNEIVGDAFVVNLNRELNDRRIKVHDLYSDEYIRYAKEWVSKERKQKHQDLDWSLFDSRYLPEKLIKVHLNLDIYNDVAAYYYWQDDEIFGVEIYNERVATLQKQIHDVLWGMAVKKPDGINWTKHGLG